MNKIRRVLSVLSIGVGMMIASSASLHAQSQLDAVDFRADYSVIDEATLRVTMTGNVHLSTDGMELKANEVIVQLIEEAGGSIEFSEAYANGNVWGRYDDIFITSNKLTYRDRGQYAVFSGDVKVNQKGNRVRSSEVRLNLESGVVELVGGIQGKISGGF